MIHVSRRQLIRQMEDAAGDIRTFCAQPFTNYMGTAEDTGQPLGEIVADWCTENWVLFDKMPGITRELPYRDPLRDGTRPRRLSRAEEILSRDLYVRFHPGSGSRLNILGHVLDYQMPLGNRAAEHAGKVDLVTWDGGTLRLLKVKTQGSTDSMLRSLLESFTHLRTVNTEKLLEDFGLPPEAEVSAAPFVYLEGHQRGELKEHPAALHRLMLRSGVRPIWYVP